MRRVVLDTNVIISAFLTPNGSAAKILRMITYEQLRIYYSSDILAEYTEVLSRSRFKFAVEDREGFTNGVSKVGILVEPAISSVAFVDEADRIFYDAAKFCDANLITGNLKHYPSESFIISPVEFLALHHGGELNVRH